MGFFDSFKNIFDIPEDDEFDEEVAEATEEKAEPKRKSFQNESAPARKSESTPRVIGGGKSKTLNISNAQMQVVLVKPDRYEEVTDIADHLNDRKTVVLNLEGADKDTARRIVDFLSGAAYANHGNMKKVSKGTFLIVPNGVDMMGEVMLEDFEEGHMYF